MWRAIQLYTRSVGIIMKKLPMGLLKAANKYQDGEGGSSEAIRLFRKVKLHSAAKNQLKAFARRGEMSTEQADALAGYVEDVLNNFQTSKHCNVYVAFTTKKTSAHGGQLELVGLVASGSFVRHRKHPRDDETTRHYSIMPEGVGAGSSAGELELIVTKGGYGKALALWGIGDLLMRSTHGEPRYTHVLALTVTDRSIKLFTDLGFKKLKAEEFEQGMADPVAAGETVMSVKNTQQTAQHLLKIMKRDRQQLYDLCPTGPTVPSWQRCR